MLSSRDGWLLQKGPVLLQSFLTCYLAHKPLSSLPAISCTQKGCSRPLSLHTHRHKTDYNSCASLSVFSEYHRNSTASFHLKRCAHTRHLYQKRSPDDVKGVFLENRCYQPHSYNPLSETCYGRDCKSHCCPTLPVAFVLLNSLKKFSLSLNID